MTAPLGRWIGAVSCLALGACVNPGWGGDPAGSDDDSATPSDDDSTAPDDDLDADDAKPCHLDVHAALLAGPEAVACGEADVDESRRAVHECLVDAYRSGHPFWGAWYDSGIDSIGATGFAWDAVDLVWSLSWDSAPSGGHPDDREPTLDGYRCLVVEVEETKRGEQLRCALAEGPHDLCAR